MTTSASCTMNHTKSTSDKMEKSDGFPPSRHAAMKTIADFEAHAAATLPRNAWDYYSSGAMDMLTLRANQRAFMDWALLPRACRSKKASVTVDARTQMFGRSIRSPVCAAATAMQRMAHDEGECGGVAAAAAVGTLHVLSSWATASIEEVAAAAPDGYRWFQLYVYRDRKLTASIVRRAEAAGYAAIVLTIDTPILGRREADVRNTFQLPPHLQLGILKDAGSQHAEGVKASQGESGLAEFVRQNIDASLQWSDVQWLRKLTKLPVLLKGVMTKEDAVLAVKHGVDGIIVSNHGARQLDSCNATVRVLPEVVDAVGADVPVFLDGGVRSGRDAFKAVALGARAVFVGRPLLWGLAAGGKQGAMAVLDILHKEFVAAMKLTGCTRVEDISADCLMVASQRPFHRSKL